MDVQREGGISNTVKYSNHRKSRLRRTICTWEIFQLKFQPTFIFYAFYIKKKRNVTFSTPSPLPPSPLPPPTRPPPPPPPNPVAPLLHLT